MYTIYADGHAVYIPGDADLALASAKVSLALSKSGSLEITAPVTNKAASAIKKLASTVIVYEDGEELFCGRAVSTERAFDGSLSIVCEGELAYLMDSIQPPHEFHAMTSRGLLEYFLNIHNQQVSAGKSTFDKTFRVGQVTVRDPNDSLYRYTNWENTLEAIQEKFLDPLGGLVRVRRENGARYLDLIEDCGVVSEQVIEFGENLLDYCASEDAAEIATRVIPLGARLEESPIEALEAYTTIESVNGGRNYVESAEAVASLGVVTRVVNFDDVTVPANLKEHGERYLKDAQFAELSLKCTAVDLHDMDVDIARIRLGDEVRVLSAPHGMDRRFTVSALEIDLMDASANTITLGSSGRETLSAAHASAARTLKSKIESLPATSSILKQAKDNATELINAATTGHVVVRPDEILIMDTDDVATAKRVWRWGSGGLGYSTAGYKGPFGVAITRDGAIVANFITAGTMTANRIKAGTLSDAKGNMSWNLETGAISAKRLSVASTNFTLTEAGVMTAKGAVIDGTVTATSGDSSVQVGTGRLRISYKNKELGLIGGNGYALDAKKCGLNFDLNVTGDYMTWACQPSKDADYDMKWTYARTKLNNYAAGMLHAGCDIDMHGFQIKNVSWPGGGIDGTCHFVRVTSMGSDGHASQWSNSNYMQFKNGILIAGAFS